MIPLFQVQERLLRREGVAANKDNANRIFRMSPIICGLVLYQYRFRHREAALAVADAWGSIQYAGHLCNTLDRSGLLKGRWEDMDIAKTLLGPERFFVGGEEPRTLADQLRKYCLQMGVSAAALSKKSRKGRELASKAGPSGLKVNAPVTTMFEERYANDSDIVLTAEQVERIVELSTLNWKPMKRLARVSWAKSTMSRNLRTRRSCNTKSKTTRGNVREPASLASLSASWHKHWPTQCRPKPWNFASHMLMHRWCWRMFRSVRDACDPQLRQILGPDYL